MTGMGYGGYEAMERRDRMREEDIKSEFEAALCEKAERYGERRILDKLREAVAQECRCSLSPLDGADYCPACKVLHRVTGGEG